MCSSDSLVDLEQCGAVSKQIATLRAKLALAGYSLNVIDTGASRPTFMVGRWAMTRTLPDVHAVQQFMRQVGVQP